MRKVVNRLRRPLAWTLTLAVAVVFSANCVAGSEMTEAEKACCAAMGSDCDHGSQQQDCCSIENPQVERFTAAKPTAVPLPEIVIGPFAAAPDTLHHSVVDYEHRVDGIAPKLPGIPTYLLLSTFLI